MSAPPHGNPPSFSMPPDGEQIVVEQNGPEQATERGTTPTTPPTGQAPDAVLVPYATTSILQQKRSVEGTFAHTLANVKTVKTVRPSWEVNAPQPHEISQLYDLEHRNQRHALLKKARAEHRAERKAVAKPFSFPAVPRGRPASVDTNSYVPEGSAVVDVLPSGRSTAPLPNLPPGSLGATTTLAEQASVAPSLPSAPQESGPPRVGEEFTAATSAAQPQRPANAPGPQEQPVVSRGAVRETVQPDVIEAVKVFAQESVNVQLTDEDARAAWYGFNPEQKEYTLKLCARMMASVAPSPPSAPQESGPPRVGEEFTAATSAAQPHAPTRPANAPGPEEQPLVSRTGSAVRGTLQPAIIEAVKVFAQESAKLQLTDEDARAAWYGFNSEQKEYTLKLCARMVAQRNIAANEQAFSAVTTKRIVAPGNERTLGGTTNPQGHASQSTLSQQARYAPPQQGQYLGQGPSHAQAPPQAAAPPQLIPHQLQSQHATLQYVPPVAPHQQNVAPQQVALVQPPNLHAGRPPNLPPQETRPAPAPSLFQLPQDGTYTSSDVVPGYLHGDTYDVMAIDDSEQLYTSPTFEYEEVPIPQLPPLTFSTPQSMSAMGYAQGFNGIAQPQPSHPMNLPLAGSNPTYESHRSMAQPELQVLPFEEDDDMGLASRSDKGKGRAVETEDIMSRNTHAQGPFPDQAQPPAPAASGRRRQPRAPPVQPTTYPGMSMPQMNQRPTQPSSQVFPEMFNAESTVFVMGQLQGVKEVLQEQKEFQAKMMYEFSEFKAALLAAGGLPGPSHRAQKPTHFETVRDRKLNAPTLRERKREDRVQEKAARYRGSRVTHESDSDTDEEVSGKKADLIEDKHKTRLKARVRHTLEQMLQITDWSEVAAMYPPLTAEEIASYKKRDGSFVLDARHFRIDFKNPWKKKFGPNMEAREIFIDHYLSRVAGGAFFQNPTPPHLLTRENLGNVLDKHMEYCRKRWRRSDNPLDPARALEIARRMARNARRRTLHESRWVVISRRPELKRHARLFTLLEPCNMSGDETDGPVKTHPPVWRMRVALWQSRKLRKFLWTRDDDYREDWEKPVHRRAMGGNVPRTRVFRPGVVEEGIAPIGLWRNCYDKHWLESQPAHLVRELEIIQEDYDFGLPPSDSDEE